MLHHNHLIDFRNIIVRILKQLQHKCLQISLHRKCFINDKNKVTVRYMFEELVKQELARVPLKLDFLMETSYQLYKSHHKIKKLHD